MLRSQKISRGPRYVQSQKISAGSRYVQTAAEKCRGVGAFLCVVLGPNSGLTICKTHLIKPDIPPLFSPRALPFSARGSACGCPVSRTPQLIVSVLRPSPRGVSEGRACAVLLYRR